MLTRLNKAVQPSDAFLKRQRLADLPEPKRRLDLQRDGQDKTGAAEAANRSEEEIGSLLAGTAYARAVCQQQGQGDDVSGDHAVIDACSVRRGGDDATERLVGDGADVAHGEAVLGERGVQGVESDASLDDGVAFLGVDLVEDRMCKHNRRRRNRRTSRIRSSLVVRSMYPEVHGRSLGE